MPWSRRRTQASTSRIRTRMSLHWRNCKCPPAQALSWQVRVRHVRNLQGGAAHLLAQPRTALIAPRRAGTRSRITHSGRARAVAAVVPRTRGPRVTRPLDAMRLNNITTPAAIVDVRKMRANIRRMQQRMDLLGVKFRPHVKTAKCVEIVREQLAAGAQGITVSTLKEAEAFFKEGVRDIL